MTLDPESEIRELEQLLDVAQAKLKIVEEKLKAALLENMALRERLKNGGT